VQGNAATPPTAPVQPVVEGRGNPAVPVAVKKVRRVTKDGAVVGASAKETTPVGTGNTVFTAEEKARRDEERRKRNAGKMNAGLDPADLADLVFDVGFYVESGIRALGDIVKKIRETYGSGADSHVKTVRIAYTKALAKIGEQAHATTGGRVDFTKLHDLMIDRPKHLKAIRLVLGVDDDGHRIKPFVIQRAVEDAGIGRGTGGSVTGANLTSLMGSLGLTPDVRTKFIISGDTDIPPLEPVDPDVAPATLEAVLAAQEADPSEQDLREEQAFNDLGPRLQDEQFDEDIMTSAKGGAARADTQGVSESAGGSMRHTSSFAKSKYMLAVNGQGGIENAPTGILLLAQALAPTHLMISDLPEGASDIVRANAVENSLIYSHLRDELLHRERQDPTKYRKDAIGFKNAYSKYISDEERANEKRAAKRNSTKNPEPVRGDETAADTGVSDGELDDGQDGPTEVVTDEARAAAADRQRAIDAEYAKDKPKVEKVYVTDELPSKGSVTIKGPNGGDLVIPDAGAQLIRQSNKISRLQALLKCLSAG
jgi:hypothetical protein